MKAFQGSLFDELRYEFKKMFADVKLCVNQKAHDQKVLKFSFLVEVKKEKFEKSCNLLKIILKMPNNY